MGRNVSLVLVVAFAFASSAMLCFSSLRMSANGTFFDMARMEWNENMIAAAFLNTKTRGFLSSTVPRGEPVTTVAYLISITGCSTKFVQNAKLYDMAAVLKKSIDLNSYPRHSTSRYASKAFVITTPETRDSKCVELLQAAGFEPKLFDFPVQIDSIQEVEGAILRDRIGKDGCCGEKELIKLHVYSMTDYKVAIHLDLDTLVVQPLDPVIDAMVFPPSHETGRKARQRLFAPTTQDSNHERLATPTYNASVLLEELDIRAYYTKDYNMLPRNKEKIGLQGGVIMVKPNATTRDELIAMVRSGQYFPGRDEGSGWFKSGYGLHIWGALTIQGLLAYYYTEVAHDVSVELHRCRFNQIAENPRRSSFNAIGKYPRGTPILNNASFHDLDCRDGRPQCDDVQCQTWPMDETYILHYTYCKVPVSCVDGAWEETLKDRQCLRMQKEWFSIRKLLAQEANQSVPFGEYFPELYQGFCRAAGDYIPLPEPNTIRL